MLVFTSGIHLFVKAVLSV